MDLMIQRMLIFEAHFTTCSYLNPTFCKTLRQFFCFKLTNLFIHRYHMKLCFLATINRIEEN